ncbi:MAG: restriction endonuclease subunit S, partial [Bacteroidota bacterium]
IRGSDLAKLKVLYPPLSTQQRIASILSAYDDLIEVNNRRIKLLEETARELYKEWFVRMRFPGYKEAKFVKGVPEGIGEVKYFKDFIKLNRGFDLPEEKIQEGNYPVIASTSIKGYHNQFKVKGPIITTGRSGSLGTVLFVNQDGWPLNTSLYVKDFKGNNPLYVFYTLKLLDFESFNSGAGVPTLNQNHLHKLKIWIANETLQNKFKNMVGPIFQQIEIIKEQNTQLRQIRDRLLPRLISGKLEVS